MEYLLNHSDLCALIYSGQYEKALHIFKETYEVKLTKVCITHCKLYLSSLNQSLYNYILLKENVSVHRCCLVNHQKINFCCSLEEIYTIGREILTSYSFCQEYLIEKYKNPHIKEALIYIHEHLTLPLSLEEIAEHINISPNYLCHLFKLHTNRTIKDYINLRRIVLAKKLLRETHLTLEEVSIRCGYNNYSYFCRQFKQHTNTSPYSFRKT